MIEVRVERLVHVYPSGVRALDGLDLSVGPGEAVAIMGPNGCGKTTLVRHLDGLLRPTSGRVLIGGEDAARSRVAHLAARVGLCFQDPDDQLFARSVRDEVAFGPRNLGRPAADVGRAVAAALETTGLADAATLNPGDLGASRRRLLAIASVLAMETPVVVLDEPTTGQDARGIDRVRSIVAGLRAEGRTVIAVSHDMRFVAESFERLVIMREGRVELDGRVSDILAQERWDALARTSLEPTHAARVGARLGLGPTPTDASVVARLASVAKPGRHPPAT